MGSAHRMCNWYSALVSIVVADRLSYDFIWLLLHVFNMKYVKYFKVLTSSNVFILILSHVCDDNRTIENYL